MTNQSALHVLVVGHVQGVFYRATTRSIAHDMGLRGWVRNLPNGQVELLALGEEKDLRAFLHYCQEGPPNAKVEELRTRWLAPEDCENIPRGFEIR
jgi:acylphosphatase